MDEPTECGLISDLLAEMATGAVSGSDRARVMRHLVICDACWDKLTDLTRVADEVLLAAPEHEPSAGFESVVLERIAALTPENDVDVARSDPPKRWRRAAAYVLAAVIAGLGSAGVVWQVTGDDRDLASAYRDTLDVADGKYLAAEELVDQDGERVGTVFMYEGEPSWLFVIAREAPDGGYDVKVDSKDGVVELGELTVRDGAGSIGATLDEHIKNIETVTLQTADGTTLVATHGDGEW